MNTSIISEIVSKNLGAGRRCIRNCRFQKLGIAARAVRYNAGGHPYITSAPLGTIPDPPIHIGCYRLKLKHKPGHVTC